MIMETEIITSHDELVKMVKDGDLFYFCVAFALNKGHRDALKEKKEIKFMVGDYEVKFEPMLFILSHQVYFARIITAYPSEVIFIGNDEDEVINDLLTELEKEK